MTDQDIKHEFALRLNELCDDKELPKHGRQTQLGKLFGVTQKAARKWLLGEGLPEYETSIAIAEWGGVHLDWLMRGKGPKRGKFVDMKSLVFADVMSKFSAEDRAEILGHLRYKLVDSKKLFAEEEVGRYLTMIDAFKKDADKRKE